MREIEGRTLGFDDLCGLTQQRIRALDCAALLPEITAFLKPWGGEAWIDTDTLRSGIKAEFVSFSVRHEQWDEALAAVLAAGYDTCCEAAGEPGETGAACVWPKGELPEVLAIYERATNIMQRKGEAGCE